MTSISTIDKLLVDKFYFGTTGLHITSENGNLVIYNHNGESKILNTSNIPVEWSGINPNFIVSNNFTVVVPNTKLYPYQGLVISFTRPIVQRFLPVTIADLYGNHPTNIEIVQGKLKFDWIPPNQSSTTLIFNNIDDGTTIVSDQVFNVDLFDAPAFVEFTGITLFSKSFNYNNTNKIVASFSKPLLFVTDVIASDGSTISDIQVLAPPNDNKIEFSWLTSINTPITITFDSVIGGDGTLGIPPLTTVVVLNDPPLNPWWFANQPFLPNTSYTDVTVKFNLPVSNVGSITVSAGSTATITGYGGDNVHFDYTTPADITSLIFTFNDIQTSLGGRTDSDTLLLDDYVSGNKLYLTNEHYIEWSGGNVYLTKTNGISFQLTNFTNMADIDPALENVFNDYTISKLYLELDRVNYLHVDFDTLFYGTGNIGNTSGNSIVGWIGQIPNTKQYPYTNLQLNFTNSLVAGYIPSPEIIGPGTFSNITINTGYLQFDWTTPNSDNITLTINNIWDSFLLIGGETIDVQLYDAPSFDTFNIPHFSKSFIYTGLIAQFVQDIQTISSITTDDASVVSNVLITGNPKQISFDWTTSNSNTVVISFNGLVTVDGSVDVLPIESISVSLADKPTNPIWIGQQPFIANTIYTNLVVQFDKPIQSVGGITTTNVGTTISNISIISDNLQFDCSTGNDLTGLNFDITDIVAVDGGIQETINLLVDFSNNPIGWVSVTPTTKLYQYNTIQLQFARPLVVNTPNIQLLGNGTIDTVQIVNGHLQFNWLTPSDNVSTLTINNIWDGSVLINSTTFDVDLFNSPNFTNLSQTTFTKSYNYSQLGAIFDQNILSVSSISTSDGSVISNINYLNNQILFDWSAGIITPVTFTFNDLVSADNAVDSLPIETTNITLLDPPINPTWIGNQPVTSNTNFVNLIIRFNKLISSVQSVTTNIPDSVITNIRIIAGDVLFDCFTGSVLTGSQFTINEIIAIDNTQENSYTINVNFTNPVVNWIGQVPNTKEYPYTGLVLQFTDPLLSYTTPPSIVSSGSINNISVVGGNLVFDWTPPNANSENLTFNNLWNGHALISGIIFNVSLIDSPVFVSLIGITTVSKNYTYTGIGVNKLIASFSKNIQSISSITTSDGSTVNNINLSGSNVEFGWTTLNISPVTLTFNDLVASDGTFDSPSIESTDITLVDSPDTPSWVSSQPLLSNTTYNDLAVQFNEQITSIQNIITSNTGTIISNIRVIGGNVVFNCQTSNDITDLSFDFIELLAINQGRSVSVNLPVDLVNVPTGWFATVPTTKNYPYVSLSVVFTNPIISNTPSPTVNNTGVITNISVVSGRVQFDWTPPNETISTLTFNNLWNGHAFINNQTFNVNLFDGPVFQNFTNTTVFSKNFTYSSNIIHAVFNENIQSISSIITSDLSVISNINIENNLVKFDWITSSSSSVTLTFNGLVTTNNAIDILPVENTIVTLVDPPNNPTIQGLQPNLPNTNYTDLVVRFDKQISSVSNITSGDINTIISNIRIISGDVVFDCLTGNDTTLIVFTIHDVVAVDNSQLLSINMSILTNIPVAWNSPNTTGNTQNYPHVGLQLQFTRPLVSNATPISIVADGTISNVSIVGGILQFDWNTPEVLSTDLVFNNVWDGTYMTNNETFNVILSSGPIFQNFDGIILFSKLFDYNGSNKLVAVFNEQLIQITGITPSDGSVISNITINNDKVEFDIITSTSNSLTLTFNGLKSINGVFDAVPTENVVITLADVPSNPIWISSQPDTINTVYTDLSIRFNKQILSVSNITTTSVGSVISNIRIISGDVVFDLNTGNDINNLSFDIIDVVAVDGGRSNSINVPVSFSNPIIGWVSTTPTTKQFTYTSLVVQFTRPLVSNVTPVSVLSSGTVSNISIIGGNLSFDWIAPNSNSDTLTFNDVWDGNSFVNGEILNVSLYDPIVFLFFSGLNIFSKSYSYTGVQALFNQPLLSVTSVTSDNGVISSVSVGGNTITFDWTTTSSVSETITFNGLLATNGSQDVLPLESVTVTLRDPPTTPNWIAGFNPIINISNQLLKFSVLPNTGVVSSIGSISDNLTNNSSNITFNNNEIEFNHTIGGTLVGLEFTISDIRFIDGGRTNSLVLQAGNFPVSTIPPLFTQLFPYIGIQMIFEDNITTNVPSISASGETFSNVQIFDGKLTFDWTPQTIGNVNITTGSTLNTDGFVDISRSITLVSTSPLTFVSWTLEPVSKGWYYTGLTKAIIQFNKQLSSISTINSSISAVPSNISVINDTVEFDWDLTNITDSSAQLIFSNLTAIDNSILSNNTFNITLVDPPNNPYWLNNQPINPSTLYTNIQVAFSSNILSANLTDNNLVNIPITSYLNGNIHFDFTTPIDVSNLSFIFTNLIADNGGRSSTVSLDVDNDISVDVIIPANDFQLSVINGQIVFTNTLTGLSTEITEFTNTTTGNVVIDTLINQYTITNLYFDENNALSIDNGILIINDNAIGIIPSNSFVSWTSIPTTTAYQYTSLEVTFTNPLQLNTPGVEIVTTGTVTNITIVNGKLVFDWLTPSTNNVNIVFNNLWDGSNFVDGESIDITLYTDPQFVSFTSNILFMKSSNYTGVSVDFNTPIQSVSSVSSSDGSVVSNIITNNTINVVFDITTSSSSSSILTFNNLITVDNALDVLPLESTTLSIFDAPYWFNNQPVLPNTFYSNIQIKFPKDIASVSSLTTSLVETLTISGYPSGMVQFDYTTPATLTGLNFIFSNVLTTDGFVISEYSVNLTDNNISVNKLTQSGFELEEINGQLYAKNTINLSTNLTDFTNTTPGVPDVESSFNDYDITTLYFNLNQKSLKIDSNYLQIGNIILAFFVPNNIVGFVNNIPTTKLYNYTGLEVQFTRPLVTNVIFPEIVTTGVVSNVSLVGGNLVFDWTPPDENSTVLTFNNIWDGSDMISGETLNVTLYTGPIFVQVLSNILLVKSHFYTGSEKIIVQFDQQISSVGTVSTSDGSVISNVVINNDTIEFSWLTLETDTVIITFNDLVAVNNILDVSPTESISVDLVNSLIWGNNQPSNQITGNFIILPHQLISNIQVGFNSNIQIQSVSSIMSSLGENIAVTGYPNGFIQFDYNNTSPNLDVLSFTFNNIMTTLGLMISSVSIDVINDVAADKLLFDSNNYLQVSNGQLFFTNLNDSFQLTNFSNTNSGEVYQKIFIDEYTITNLFFDTSHLRLDSNNLVIDDSVLVTNITITPDSWINLTPNTKSTTYTSLQLSFNQPLVNNTNNPIQIVTDGVINNITVFNNNLFFDWTTPNTSTTNLTFNNLWDGFGFSNNVVFNVLLYDSPTIQSTNNILVMKYYTNHFDVVFNDGIASTLIQSSNNTVNNIIIIGNTVSFDLVTGNSDNDTITFNNIISVNNATNTQTINLTIYNQPYWYINQPYNLTTQLNNITVKFGKDISSVSIVDNLNNNIVVTGYNNGVVFNYNNVSSQITSFVFSNVVTVDGENISSYTLNIYNDLNVDELISANGRVKYLDGQVSFNIGDKSTVFTDFSNTLGNINVNYLFINEYSISNLYFNDNSESLRTENSVLLIGDLIISEIVENPIIGWVGTVPNVQGTQYNNLQIQFTTPIILTQNIQIIGENITNITVNNGYLEFDWLTPFIGGEALTFNNISDGVSLVSGETIDVTLSSPPSILQIETNYLLLKSNSHILTAIFDKSIQSITNITSDDSSVISNIAIQSLQNRINFDITTTNNSSPILTFIDLVSVDNISDVPPTEQITINLNNNPYWEIQPILQQSYTNLLVKFPRNISSVQSITTSLVENITPRINNGSVEFDYTNTNHDVIFTFNNLVTDNNKIIVSVDLSLHNDISVDTIYYNGIEFTRIDGQIYVNGVQYTDFVNETLSEEPLSVHINEITIENLYFNGLNYIDFVTVSISESHLVIDDTIIYINKDSDPYWLVNQPLLPNTQYQDIEVKFNVDVVSVDNITTNLLETIIPSNYPNNNVRFDYTTSDVNNLVFTFNNLTTVNNDVVTINLPLTYDVSTNKLIHGNNFTNLVDGDVLFNNSVVSINMTEFNNVNPVYTQIPVHIDEYSITNLYFGNLFLYTDNTSNIEQLIIDDVIVEIILNNPPYWYDNQPFLSNTSYVNMEVIFSKNAVSLGFIQTSLGETINTFTITNGRVIFDYTTTDINGLEFTFVNLTTDDNSTNTVTLDAIYDLSVNNLVINNNTMNFVNGQLVFDNDVFTNFTNTSPGYNLIDLNIDTYEIDNIHFDQSILSMDGDDLVIDDVIVL